MVKMILALPKRIDDEKFVELVKDVLKGRYGDESYYSGIWFAARYIINPATVCSAYFKGYSGKASLSYYEIDAEELDPVIIYTIDDVLQFIDGANYAFVTSKVILPKDWWKPYKSFGKHYRNDDDPVVRDEYAGILAIINGSDNPKHIRIEYGYSKEERQKAQVILENSKGLSIN